MTNDLGKEAMAIYLEIVHDAIVEKKKAFSRKFTQIANMDHIRSIIRKSPKSAQTLIQLLSHAPKEVTKESKETATLHSLWIMIAYLLEYGKMDPSSLMLKRMVPGVYESAVKEIKKQGL
jgi:2-methylcitrate dehydratase PrpD